MSGDPPRLVATAQSPIPPGAILETFRGEDGADLRAAYFPPTGEPRGSVVLSPGRTEFVEKYFEVIEELRGRGFAVLAHDWRGQGLSHRMLPDRCKGHCEDWRHYVADHQALIGAFQDRLPRPCIALAHSMGGCLVALALKNELRLDAAILNAPMFGIALGRLPIWLATAVARVACLVGLGGAYIPPKAADPAQMAFADNIITHDLGRWNSHTAQLKACPDLTVGGVTWGWLDNALQAMAQAKHTAAAIDKPLLIIAAGEERVVDNRAARAFAARAPKARYVEIPGARHEVMMEADSIRAVFWAEVDRFLAEL